MQNQKGNYFSAKQEFAENLKTIVTKARELLDKLKSIRRIIGQKHEEKKELELCRRYYIRYFVLFAEQLTWLKREADHYGNTKDFSQFLMDCSILESGNEKINTLLKDIDKNLFSKNIEENIKKINGIRVKSARKLVQQRNDLLHKWLICEEVHRDEKFNQSLNCIDENLPKISNIIVFAASHFEKLDENYKCTKVTGVWQSQEKINVLEQQNSFMALERETSNLLLIFNDCLTIDNFPSAYIKTFNFDKNFKNRMKEIYSKLEKSFKTENFEMELAVNDVFAELQKIYIDYPMLNLLEFVNLVEFENNMVKLFKKLDQESSDNISNIKIFYKYSNIINALLCELEESKSSQNSFNICKKKISQKIESIKKDDKVISATLNIINNIANLHKKLSKHNGYKECLDFLTMKTINQLNKLKEIRNELIHNNLNEIDNEIIFETLLAAYEVKNSIFSGNMVYRFISEHKLQQDDKPTLFAKNRISDSFNKSEQILDISNLANEKSANSHFIIQAISDKKDCKVVDVLSVCNNLRCLDVISQRNDFEKFFDNIDSKGLRNLLIINKRMTSLLFIDWVIKFPKKKVKLIKKDFEKNFSNLNNPYKEKFIDNFISFTKFKEAICLENIKKICSNKFLRKKLTSFINDNKKKLLLSDEKIDELLESIKTEDQKIDTLQSNSSLSILNNNSNFLQQANRINNPTKDSINKRKESKSNKKNKQKKRKKRKK